MQRSNDLGLVEEANGGSVVCGDVGSWNDLLRYVRCKGVARGRIIDESQRSRIKGNAEWVVGSGDGQVRSDALGRRGQGTAVGGI